MLALFPGPYRNSGRDPVDVHRVMNQHIYILCMVATLPHSTLHAHMHMQVSGPSEESALEKSILSMDIPSPAASRKRPATRSQLQPHPKRYHGPLSDVSMCMRGCASGPLFMWVPPSAFCLMPLTWLPCDNI